MRSLGHRLFACGLLLLALQVRAEGTGAVVAIGGALLDGNDAVWGRLVTLAGGKGSCFSVLATAAGQPDEAAAGVAANLARHGATARHIRVGPRIAGQDLAAAVRDPQWLAQVRGCRGVFFTGGAQERLLDTLQPRGQGTPLLDAVREVWRSGGVVAGTSSGAAVLSAIAFRDAGDVLAVMKGRLREGLEWDRGFGLLPEGLVVDQHFIRRGRIARLLPLMQARRATWGIGVEEDSAAVFGAGTVEVIGARGVLIVDLRDATQDALLPAFNLRGARLHWLEHGDRLDLQTRRVSVAAVAPAARAPTLLQPLSPGFNGYHRGPVAFNDILAEGLLPKAMARLVDSDQRELTGLSFSVQPAADDPQPELAFEWHLRVEADTRGWLRLQPESYTLADVRLDVVPVRLQRPLFTPIATPQPQHQPPVAAR